MVPVSVVVMTYNEERNIGQCLENVCANAAEVFVVDSGSEDGTLAIAEKYNVNVVQRSHEKYRLAGQKNWILTDLPFSYEWVFFVDADELPTPELWAEIKDTLSKDMPLSAAGYHINIQLIFLGRCILHGGYYPNWGLRLFRPQYVNFVEVDGLEYARIDGDTLKLRNVMLHIDNNDLSNWIRKQNARASLASRALWGARSCRTLAKFSDSTERRTRVWMRENIWSRLPLLLRPLALFIYRYIFRLGFLDGIEGLIYITLLNFWYPFLVDAKYIELKKRAKTSGEWQ